MKNKITYSITLILGAIILFSTIFLVRSVRPFNQAKKEAVEMAKTYADLETIDEFYIYNRDNTYYSLSGTDITGKNIYVVIPKDGKKVSVFQQSDGWTKAEVEKEIKEKYQSETIKKVSLGMKDDAAVWEVVTKDDAGQFDYYLVDFKSGEIVSTIENI